jgi:hypothetical protein
MPVLQIESKQGIFGMSRLFSDDSQEMRLALFSFEMEVEVEADGEIMLVLPLSSLAVGLSVKASYVESRVRSVAAAAAISFLCLRSAAGLQHTLLGYSISTVSVQYHGRTCSRKGVLMLKDYI